MSTKKRKGGKRGRQGRESHSTSGPRGTQPSREAENWPLPIGAALLMVGIAASFMLVLQHFGAMSLPGCGRESACAKLTTGAWGSVPFLNWPVSFLGLAYFVAMLAAWTTSRAASNAPLRWVARVGAAASLMFLGVMLFQWEICYYCVLTHVGNLGFVAVIEVAARQRGLAREVPGGDALRPVATLLLTFAVATLALTGVRLWQTRTSAEMAERDLDASSRLIAESREGDAPFTGRYLLGPRDAPIRLVIISGYQCIDCGRIEREVQQIMRQRNDVSLSIKHFPMNPDCNPHMRGGGTNHRNACWAARAAEAAGILRGEDGFWEMHHWLFERGGGFTDAEMHQALRGMGYDVQQFLDVMAGDEVLRLVQEDIEEAISLGLYFTPMIFINGVELRGWQAQNAVTRAVERLAAEAPQPGTAAEDRPVGAFEKHIGDWSDQPARAIAPARPHRRLVGTTGPVRIDLWGDYDTDTPADLDPLIRAAIAGRDDVVYTFRSFPLDQACNPASPVTREGNNCLAAKAAEAAGILGGAEGFGRLHAWLLANRERLSETTLRSAAAEIGLDATALFATMESPEVAAAIRADGQTARALVGQVRAAMLFINGKRVLRWSLEGHDVLGAIIEEAAKESS